MSKTQYVAIVINEKNVSPTQAFGPFNTRDKAQRIIDLSPTGRGFTTTIRSTS